MRTDKETIGEINHVVRPSLSIFQVFINQVLKEVPIDVLNKRLGRDGQSSLAEMAELSKGRLKEIGELLDETYWNDKAMTTDKNFPNGFDSWATTHHHVASEISMFFGTRGARTTLYGPQGSGGLCLLSINLTDRFEKENEGVDWVKSGGKDYYRTLKTFLRKHF